MCEGGEGAERAAILRRSAGVRMTTQLIAASLVGGVARYTPSPSRLSLPNLRTLRSCMMRLFKLRPRVSRAISSCAQG